VQQAILAASAAKKAQFSRGKDAVFINLRQGVFGTFRFYLSLDS
jgi:hypothetical protein